MAKIDYSRAEKQFDEAIQKTRVQSLVEGKPITSGRVAEYFGLAEESPRPVQEDTVNRLLSEEAAEEEAPHNEEEEEEPLVVEVEETPHTDVMYKARKQSSRVPRPERREQPTIPPSEQFLEAISPLLILRKHILWLKRQHIDNRYEILGTTRDEIFSFRKARRLTPEQIKRINELNDRAEEVKAGILAKQALTTPEEIIEKGRKRHKRIDVKETWLPL